MLKTASSVALLLALVACATPAETEAPAGSDPVGRSVSEALTTSSLSPTDWMAETPALGAKRLNEISLPATHDSGTYDLISVYKRPVDDLFAPDADRDIIKVGQFVGITDAWSKTQEKTIAEQLDDGIRAIDLRPCREKSGTLRICHGMYGPTIEDVLGQVRTFAEAHPREIILVDMSGFHGMDSVDHGKLASLVTTKLGSFLLDAARVQPTTTLGEVWAMHAGSVIVLYDQQQPPTTAFMSSAQWQNSWQDVWDRDEKKASLESAFLTQSSDELFIFAGQATPDGNLITAGLDLAGSYPSSVAELADQTNPVVLGWVVNEWSSKRLNILSFDFYNRTCLVKVAQKLNGANVSLDGCAIGTPTAWGNYAHVSYGRGAGTPLTCAADEDMIAGLCYPKCALGHASPRAFPTVCAAACPSGYRDDGLTCFRDASILAANNSSCPWYDKCGLTFSKGCSGCPSGYSNDGCTCRRDPNMVVKTRYDRGVGKIPSSCSAGTEKGGLLCYPVCREGFHGVGPLCWPG